MQALNYAKQQGALCVGVTNTVGSAIATTTDCGIHVNAGCEIGVASTKAYTSQIVAITLLALVMAEDSVSRKRKYDAVVSALRHLPDSVRKVCSCYICLCLCLCRAWNTAGFSAAHHHSRCCVAGASCAFLTASSADIGL